MTSIEMGKFDECATRRSHHARDTFVHEHVDDVGDWLCTDAHLIGRSVSRILPRLVFNFSYIPLFRVLFFVQGIRDTIAYKHTYCRLARARSPEYTTVGLVPQRTTHNHHDREMSAPSTAGCSLNCLILRSLLRVALRGI